MKQTIQSILLLILGNCLDSVSQSNVYCIPLTEKGQFGIIDKTGKILSKIDPKYNLVWDFPKFVNGVLVSHSDKPRGTNLIDTKGGLISFIPDYLFGEFEGGYSRGDKIIKDPDNDREIFTTTKSIIDTKGHILWEGDAYNIFLLGLNKASIQVKQDSTWFILDLLTKEKTLLPDSIILNHDDKFSEGLLRFHVERNSEKKFGYLDSKGRIKINPIYSYANSFSEGLAFNRIQWNNPFAFYNKSNKIILTNSNYREDYSPFLSFFSNGLACVPNISFPKSIIKPNSDGLTIKGYVNESGEIKIPFKYIECTPFNEGIASAIEYNNGKYVHSVIDTNGQSIVSFESAVRNHFPIFWDKDVIYIHKFRTFYNKSGKVIWKPDYAYLNFLRFHRQEFAESTPIQVKTLKFEFDDKYESPVFKKIFQCENLEELDLNTSYNVFLNIPSELFKLKKLKRLNLQNVTKLPDGISSMKNLEYIGISNTTIDKLPMDILDLPNLKELQLLNHRNLIITKDFLRIAESKNIKVYYEIYRNSEQPPAEIPGTIKNK
jgi:WG containing repeat